MYKKIGLILLVLGLLLPTQGILMYTFTSEFALCDINIEREQLATAFSDVGITTIEGLSVETPFWVDMVDAEYANNGGEGVYVAVLDTGLLEIWPFFFAGANIRDDLGIGFTHDIYWDAGVGDFVFDPLRDDRGIITKTFEGSGHGTHVVSTIVGYNYNNLFWVQGVAPKASIIPILVLDAWLVPYPGGTAYFRGGTDEMVSAGIYYAADLKDDLEAPLIISMSLGGDDPSPMIKAAIDYAISKGVIVVASAGNAGYAGMGYPGAYPEVISCAMAGWTEQWIGYPARWWITDDVPEKLNTKDYWGNNWQLFLDYLSSRPNKDLGQKSFHLDLTAPGAAIVGPYVPYLSNVIGYYYLWGTSMAAPHVSAMAAILLHDYPYLDQGTMEFILKKAANKIPLPCDGALALDVPGALYYFTWYGIDYGKGFLQLGAAQKFAKTHA